MVAPLPPGRISVPAAGIDFESADNLWGGAVQDGSTPMFCLVVCLAMNPDSGA